MAPPVRGTACYPSVTSSYGRFFFLSIALGTAVFWGMIGVTLFGLVFTPVFYVVIRKLTGRKLVARGSVAARGSVVQAAE